MAYQVAPFGIHHSPPINFDEYFHRITIDEIPELLFDEVPVYPLDEVPYESEMSHLTAKTPTTVD